MSNMQFPSSTQKSPIAADPSRETISKIAADITELLITTQGNRYVLVVMDYFTRFVNLFPLKDQHAITVSKCIFEDYIGQHSLPESIHTDQGRQFESDLVKHFCSLLGIDKTHTSPYHAQSHGMVERLNRTLKGQLCNDISQSGGDGTVCHSLSLPITLVSIQIQVSLCSSLCMGGNWTCLWLSCWTAVQLWRLQQLERQQRMPKT